MNAPWWFGLGMSLLLVVLVVRYGRWFLELFRAQRDGRMDPDALWPPGRTEGPRPPSGPPPGAGSGPGSGTGTNADPSDPTDASRWPDAPRRSDFPTRDPLVDPFDPNDLGRPGSPDGPPA